MQFALRKVNGVFGAVLMPRGGYRGTPGGVRRVAMSMYNVLTSPIALAVLIVALALAWVAAIAHVSHLLTSSHDLLGSGLLSALPFMGTTGRLQDLQEKRSKIVADARAILDKAQSEGRGLSAEETANYDKALKDQDELRTQIERETRQADLDREMLEQRGRGNGRPADPTVPGSGTSDPNVPEAFRSSPFASQEYRSAYRKFLSGGVRSLNEAETRALNATDDTSGGFLRAPIQMVAGILKRVDDQLFMRKLGTSFQVPSAASLGVVRLETDPDDADWTTELAVGNEDAAMAFGRRELHPKPLAKLLKISNKLLRSAGQDPEALVMNRLAYKFALPQEKAFLTGDGVKGPLGVFTASNDGVSTARDVSTGNTNTAVTFDGLLAAKFALKAQYLAKASWLFSRAALLQISQIKDGEGRYLWEPSRQAGQPDQLLALPYNMSEYSPSTFTTGKYVGALADWSFYWIADAMDLSIQRLVELFATTNQTGYIGRLETDGQPVLDEAFVRVKLT